MCVLHMYVLFVDEVAAVAFITAHSFATPYDITMTSLVQASQAAAPSSSLLLQDIIV